MTVWIFILIIFINSKEVHIATNIEYAFISKTDCESVIKNKDTLKCIELKVE